MDMRLLERLEQAFHGTEVDVDKGVVKGVSLLGLESLNGYRYSEEAVKKAVVGGLYNHAQIYADHAPDGATAPRGMAELVGVTLDARYDEEAKRVRADVRVLKASEMGRVFLEAATDPVLSKSVGMSHDCDGKMDDKTKTVTEIARVHSVDFVTRPATTGGIHEEVKEQNMDELKELREQVAALTKANEDAAKALKEAADAKAKAESDAAALRESQAKAETAALVERESADLPDSARDALREDFKDRAASAEVVKAAVGRVRKMLEGVGAKDRFGAPVLAGGPRFSTDDVKPGEDGKLLESAFARFGVAKN